MSFFRCVLLIGVFFFSPHCFNVVFTINIPTGYRKHKQPTLTNHSSLSVVSTWHLCTAATCVSSIRSLCAAINLSSVLIISDRACPPSMLLLDHQIALKRPSFIKPLSQTLFFFTLHIQLLLSLRSP